jgi:hypothetical protein
MAALPENSNRKVKGSTKYCILFTENTDSMN